jgi:hypothetical protein
MESMRSLVSLLVVALIAIGAYSYFLKRAAPAPGQVATQSISTTGVQMDLNAIAQAQRLYFAQNGTYASLDQLVSSGAMNLTAGGRDGYTYTVETSSSGFLVTASHPDIPAGVIEGSQTIHYPTFSIDQSMQIRQSD